MLPMPPPKPKYHVTRCKRACALDPRPEARPAAGAPPRSAGGFWACFGPERRGMALRALKKHIYFCTKVKFTFVQNTCTFVQITFSFVPNRHGLRLAELRPENGLKWAFWASFRHFTCQAPPALKLIPPLPGLPPDPPGETVGSPADPEVVCVHQATSGSFQIGVAFTPGIAKCNSSQTICMTLRCQQCRPRR